jgi:hypothetical protein
LIVWLALYLTGRFRCVEVRIVNRSMGPMSEVRLHFRGGTKSLDRIDYENFASACIRPSGESDLSLSYVDGQGKRVERKIGTYIEPRYGGMIGVDVRSEGVDVSQHISLW